MEVYFAENIWENLEASWNCLQIMVLTFSYLISYLESQTPSESICCLWRFAAKSAITRWKKEWPGTPVQFGTIYWANCNKYQISDVHDAHTNLHDERENGQGSWREAGLILPEIGKKCWRQRSKQLSSGKTKAEEWQQLLASRLNHKCRCTMTLLHMHTRRKKHRRRSR